MWRPGKVLAENHRSVNKITPVDVSTDKLHRSPAAVNKDSVGGAAAQGFQPEGAGAGIEVENESIRHPAADDAEKGLACPVGRGPDAPVAALCIPARGCKQPPSPCRSPYDPQLQVVPRNYFSDLHRVEGRSLQNVVGHDPEVDAVFD